MVGSIWARGDKAPPKASSSSGTGGTDGTYTDAKADIDSAPPDSLIPWPRFARFASSAPVDEEPSEHSEGGPGEQQQQLQFGDGSQILYGQPRLPSCGDIFAVQMAGHSRGGLACVLTKLWPYGTDAANGPRQPTSWIMRVVATEDAEGED